MKNFENILTMILVFLPQTLNTEFLMNLMKMSV